MRRSTLERCVALFTLLLLTGCSGNNWKKCQVAKGRIIFKNKALANAEIWLIPITPSLKNQNPTIAPYGKTDADGRFVLSTYVDGDGAPEGEYQAKVICEAATGRIGGDDDRPESRNILPAKYENPETSGIKIVISVGENTVPDIEIK
jgi:hypothetical protein